MDELAGNDVEGLRKRVEAVTRALGSIDQAHGQRERELIREIHEVNASIAHLNGMVAGMEKRNRQLTEENRQLKEMLLSFLAAVETFSVERLQGAVRTMDTKIAALASAPPPEVAPASAPKAGSLAAHRPVDAMEEFLRTRDPLEGTLGDDDGTALPPTRAEWDALLRH